jgi:hypothetical protein
MMKWHMYAHILNCIESCRKLFFQHTVVAASLASVAVVSVGLLVVYFKKRKALSREVCLGFVY